MANDVILFAPNFKTTKTKDSGLETANIDTDADSNVSIFGNYDNQNEIAKFNLQDSLIGKIFNGISDFVDKLSNTFNEISNKIEEAKKDYETMDGKIDDTYQRGTGDCWLLSGVNAIRYTETGTKILNETFDYQGNFDTAVHLKGAKDYTITKSELDKAREMQKQGSWDYSVGDNDMLILELVTEKVFNDIKEGNAIPAKFVSSGIESYFSNLKNKSNADTELIESGPEQIIMSLITGKDAQSIGYSCFGDNEEEREDIEKALDEFDGKNIALGASVSGDEAKTVKDIYGNKVTLATNHAFAIKDVSKENGTVTVVNPWDSSEEIVLQRDVFLNNFGSVTKCDLNGRDINYIIYCDEIDEEGNKIFRENLKEPIYYDNDNEIDVYQIEKKYDTEGRLIEENYLGKDGNMSESRKSWFNNDGEKYLNEYTEHYKNSPFAVSFITEYKDEGIDHHSELRKYDKSGNIEESMIVSAGTRYALQSRDISGYQQFDLGEIGFLADLEDKDWEKVEKFLKKNPNASFEDVESVI